MTRTDPHSHKALNPDDYTWVGYTDDGDQFFGRMSDGPLFPPIGALGVDRGRYDRLRREANPSGVRNAIHPGGCDACGQGNLRYRHYFRHDPTGDVIVLGNDCVRRMDFPSDEAFKAAKKLEAERALALLRKEREEWESENYQAACFLNEVAGETRSAGDSQYFIVELHHKLYKYGSLTENQTAAIKKVMVRTEERESDVADGTVAEIPDELCEGRHKIEGVVEKYAWKKSPGEVYGRDVMTVKDDRGFRVWGTCPQGTIPAIDIDASDETGDKHPRVSFYCTIKRKESDKTFGFFKRPTKGAIVAMTGEGNKGYIGYKED